MNSKLHAVCDGAGKPITLLLSEGQMSDHKGARLILKALPSATCLIADRDYDSNWFREALADKDIERSCPHRWCSSAVAKPLASAPSTAP
ncbi:transposase [Sinorhizobium meliloti]|uniref:transposase n=1 Tax=Rhizobium meliloti TaxID=382 RepID=UPI003988C0DD